MPLGGLEYLKILPPYKNREKLFGFLKVQRDCWCRIKLNFQLLSALGLGFNLAVAVYKKKGKKTGRTERASGRRTSLSIEDDGSATSIIVAILRKRDRFTQPKRWICTLFQV